MAKMEVKAHQLVEQLVQTHVLSAILCTLNEISHKLQHPDHQINERCFDRKAISDEINSIREHWQKYIADQLPTDSDDSSPQN